MLTLCIHGINDFNNSRNRLRATFLKYIWDLKDKKKRINCEILPRTKIYSVCNMA